MEKRINLELEKKRKQLEELRKSRFERAKKTDTPVSFSLEKSSLSSNSDVENLIETILSDNNDTCKSQLTTEMQQQQQAEVEPSFGNDFTELITEPADKAKMNENNSGPFYFDKQIQVDSPEENENENEEEEVDLMSECKKEEIAAEKNQKEPPLNEDVDCKIIFGNDHGLMSLGSDLEIFLNSSFKLIQRIISKEKRNDFNLAGNFILDALEDISTTPASNADLPFTLANAQYKLVSQPLLNRAVVKVSSFSLKNDKNSHLLLVVHSAPINELTSNDEFLKGLIVIYNVEYPFPNEAESILLHPVSDSSEITCAFVDCPSGYVVAGTRTGNILLFDIQNGKNSSFILPFIISPAAAPSSRSNRTEAAAAIVALVEGKDGCFWSCTQSGSISEWQIDLISSGPQKTFDLASLSILSGDDFVLSFGIFFSNTAMAWIGTFKGKLFEFTLSSTDSNSSNLKINTPDVPAKCILQQALPTLLVQFNERCSEVQTKIHSNKEQTSNAAEFCSDIFICGGLDSVLNVYCTNDRSSIRSLCAFDSISFTSIFSAIAWNPVHSSYFAAGDTSGCIYLFNLYENHCESNHQKNSSIIHSAKVSKNAIRSLAWGEDGTTVFAGTLDGIVLICKMNAKCKNSWENSA